MSREPALLFLLEGLAKAGYRFVTVTPETHRRVIERSAGRTAGNLRDVFGWNLPFEQALLPPRLRDALDRSGLVSRE
ncbi:MAG TPA: methyltransferase, partial [Allosphingosinicella sp.]|nr:methyltransferase [Allosphingosinicella sp.]